MAIKLIVTRNVTDLLEDLIEIMEGMQDSLYPTLRFARADSSGLYLVNLNGLLRITVQGPKQSFVVITSNWDGCQVERSILLSNQRENRTVPGVASGVEAETVCLDHKSSPKR